MWFDNRPSYIYTIKEHYIYLYGMYSGKNLFDESILNEIKETYKELTGENPPRVDENSVLMLKMKREERMYDRPNGPTLGDKITKLFLS